MNNPIFRHPQIYGGVPYMPCEIVPVGAVAEQADAVDLKSTGGDTLRVQVPPAPLVRVQSTHDPHI